MLSNERVSSWRLLINWSMPGLARAAFKRGEVSSNREVNCSEFKVIHPHVAGRDGIDPSMEIDFPFP